MSLFQLAKAPFGPLRTPEFRHPHHSASSVSIIGGGSTPKPGEVSLAHHGVLFPDELGEFSKKTLDMLRQPLENEKVTISRAHSTVTYPAKFIFIAAMNPCPCGYLGSENHYCVCSPKQIKSYKTRVSGPILDRIDNLLSLKPVNMSGGGADLSSDEASEIVRERVKIARERQYERYRQEICNASVPFEWIVEKGQISNQLQQQLQTLAIKKGLSNRVQLKILRLARTIADLKGEETTSEQSLKEAMLLRKIRW